MIRNAKTENVFFLFDKFIIAVNGSLVRSQRKQIFLKFLVFIVQAVKLGSTI